jgi:hypothetical protein
VAGTAWAGGTKARNGLKDSPSILKAVVRLTHHGRNLYLVNNILGVLGDLTMNHSLWLVPAFVVSSMLMAGPRKIPNELHASERLEEGQPLFSPAKLFKAVVEPGGKFRLYKHNLSNDTWSWAKWESPNEPETTDQHGEGILKYWLTMTDDGTLQLLSKYYYNGRPKVHWQSRQRQGCFLRLDDKNGIGKLEIVAPERGVVRSVQAK